MDFCGFVFISESPHGLETAVSGASVKDHHGQIYSFIRQKRTDRGQRLIQEVQSIKAVDDERNSRHMTGVPEGIADWSVYGIFVTT